MLRASPSPRLTEVRATREARYRCLTVAGVCACMIVPSILGLVGALAWSTAGATFRWVATVLALLYLAKRAKVLSDTWLGAKAEFLLRMPNYVPGEGPFLLARWGEALEPFEKIKAAVQNSWIFHLGPGSLYPGKPLRPAMNVMGVRA